MRIKTLERLVVGKGEGVEAGFEGEHSELGLKPKQVEVLADLGKLKILKARRVAKQAKADTGQGEGGGEDGNSGEGSGTGERTPTGLPGGSGDQQPTT
ncbi:MAG: hypothetical protein JJU06_05780 [Ectothiorhodospiraceae bacterium]|nr:hypothetical protein [Ectothiorhodospiraceae bacterium]MCH8502915.1 hypothetical protein [Ectothiorhodospiraceae bacterium]